MVSAVVRWYASGMSSFTVAVKLCVFKLGSMVPGMAGRN